MTQQILKRDRVYAIYFVVHTFISLAIDSWIALPSYLVSTWQQRLADFHIRSNNDILFASRPVWLQTFVWLEILFQVPYFIWAAYDLSAGNPRVWAATLIYGVEAACTTLACLGEVCLLDLPPKDRINLFFVYLPTFIIPMILVFDFYTRINNRIAKVKTE